MHVNMLKQVSISIILCIKICSNNVLRKNGTVFGCSKNVFLSNLNVTFYQFDAFYLLTCCKTFLEGSFGQ